MRGMVAGEPIVSQAQTKEFDEGYDRTFGAGKKPVRGKWVMTDHGLVDLNAYVPEARALDAPILSGRFYEDAPPATDGTPLNSRARHERYMRENGVAMASDFKECGAKAAAERLAFREGRQDDRDIRETVGRVMYDLEQKGRRR